uniref:Uncharacterized protein n=1 Tax=Arundo donax TaxID=35708 RepID=A0A0A8Z7Z5_ARUDO
MSLICLFNHIKMFIIALQFDQSN